MNALAPWRCPAPSKRVRAAAARGETDVRRLEAVGLAELDGAGVTVDYLALVDGSSLEPLQSLRLARGC